VPEKLAEKLAVLLCSFSWNHYQIDLFSGNGVSPPPPRVFPFALPSKNPMGGSRDMRGGLCLLRTSSNYMGDISEKGHDHR